MATEPPIVRSPRALRTPRSISSYLPYMPTLGLPKPALDPAAGLWSTGSMPQDRLYADQAPPEVFAPAVEAPAPAKAVDPAKAPAVAAAKQAAASAPGGPNPSHMNDAAPPARRRSPIPDVPWMHATPMSEVDPWNPSGEAMTQGQLEGDYNAHEVINARHAQAMKAIKDAEAERGDPMEKKIRAEAMNAQYEDLMPLNTGQSSSVATKKAMAERVLSEAKTTGNKQNEAWATQELARLQEGGEEGTFTNEPPVRRRGEERDMAMKMYQEAERAGMMQNLELARQNVEKAQATGDPATLAKAMETFTRLMEMTKVGGTLSTGRNLGFYSQPDYGLGQSAGR